MMIVVRMRRWRLYGFFEEPDRLQLPCDPFNLAIGVNYVVSVQDELAITSKRPYPKTVTTVLFQKVAMRLKQLYKFIKIDLSWRLIPTQSVSPARNT